LSVKPDERSVVPAALFSKQAVAGTIILVRPGRDRPVRRGPLGRVAPRPGTRRAGVARAGAGPGRRRDPSLGVDRGASPGHAHAGLVRLPDVPPAQRITLLPTSWVGMRRYWRRARSSPCAEAGSVSRRVGR